MPNKSVVKLILAMLFCLLSLPAFTANSYPTAWSSGVFDDSDYLATDNAWLTIPNAGSCRIGSLHVAANGDMICRQFTDNSVYMRPLGSLTWVHHPEFGSTMADVIEADGQHIYALGPGGIDWAACQTGGPTQWSILKWSGTAWTPEHGCLVQMNVSSDRVLVGANIGGNAYKSTDEGNSWTQLSIGGGYFVTYINAFTVNKMCALAGGQLQMSVSGSAFAAISPQPNGLEVEAGHCDVGSDSLIVWGTKTSLPHIGVQHFDYNNNVWTSITGFVPSWLDSRGKGMTVASDSSGATHHLNDLPAFISGLMTGSVDGCPPGTPCSTINPPTHTGDLVATFPHGICKANPNDSRCPSYATHHLAIPPTSNMYIQSWDLSLSCDPFFGDLTSSECQPESSGSVICSVSLVNLADSSANNPPGLKGLSYYLAAFDGNIISNVTTPIPGGWVTDTECGSTINACSPMTQHSAVCMPPYIDDFVTSHTTLPEQLGPVTITYTMAQNFGILSCQLHDGAKPTYLVWRIVSRYNVKVGAISCKPFPVLETTLYGDQCF